MQDGESEWMSVEAASRRLKIRVSAVCALVAVGILRTERNGATDKVCARDVRHISTPEGRADVGIIETSREGEVPGGGHRVVAYGPDYTWWYGWGRRKDASVR